MKIVCDVCDRDEASVFCTADEAALCDGCDRRVHHVNKLASKHHRFSLLHPSATHFPVCDICQEKRAFLFCQQDRAILCRDCDLPIHAINEHTQKHDRFLLTGIQLSRDATIDTSCSSSEASLSMFNPDRSSQPLFYNASATVSNSASVGESSTSNVAIACASTVINNEIGGEPTSSISELLIETVPGWQFEEFLDGPSAPFGLCKSDDGDDKIFPFRGAVVETRRDSSSESSTGSSLIHKIWIFEHRTPCQRLLVTCDSVFVNCTFWLILYGERCSLFCFELSTNF